MSLPDLFHPSMATTLEQTLRQITESIEYQKLLAELETKEMTIDLDVTAWFSTLSITECIEENQLTLDAGGNLVIRDVGTTQCAELEAMLALAVQRSGTMR